MADTLREYLIGLGYKVDEAGWRKFNAAVARSATGVIELGAEATATGLAIAAMVERVARHYEELYYISQRTDASVSNLKSYGLAAKQVGLSVEAMTAAQESFSAAQRMNPGIVGLIRQFSNATDKGDQLIDTVAGLKKQFGEAGYFAAARVASLVGLDEPTFRMLWMNLERFKASQAEQKQLMRDAGVDADASAKKFTDFARDVNKLGEQFKVLGDRIALDFLPYVSAGVRHMSDLVGWFTKFNKETEGSAGMLGAIATGAFGTYVAKRLLGRLLGGAAAGAAAGGGGAATAAGGAAAVAGAPLTATALVAGVLLAQSTREANKGEKDLYKWNPATGQYEPTDELRRQQAAAPSNAQRFRPAGAGAGGGGGPDIGNVTGMNAELVERLRLMRKEMPEGMGGFRVHSGYRTPEEQAKLYADRGRNPYPVAKSSQHSLGEAADLKFDTAAGDQWFRAQMAKYGIASPVRGDPVHFERSENRMAGKHPFLGAALTPAPGEGGGVTLQQRTEIKVEPGPTSVSTAQAVLEGQQRVNADAVRNLGAKVR